MFINAFPLLFSICFTYVGYLHFENVETSIPKTLSFNKYYFTFDDLLQSWYLSVRLVFNT